MIRLISEVLASRNGCPACGSKRPHTVKVCTRCDSEIGEAREAVDRVVEATCDALFGSTMANAGEVVRGTVWGPFLANTRIDLNAQFHPAKGDIGAYWHCKRGVPGGFVSVFIFGDGLRAGDRVCGLTELKVKFVPTYPDEQKRPVHYFRVQVVPGVRSDVRVVVLEPQDIERLANDYLPAMILRNQEFGAAVGFLSEKPDAGEEEK